LTARTRERLERALDELRPVGNDRDARRRRRRGRRSASSRAAHGANVTAILEHVELHPGATAGDLARATNISRGAIYSALSRMASAGRLRRESRPDGTVGYYIAENETPA
jgi:DNA-binding MarR family transcriptional regulator